MARDAYVEETQQLPEAIAPQPKLTRKEKLDRELREGRITQAQYDFLLKEGAGEEYYQEPQITSQASSSAQARRDRMTSYLIFALMALSLASLLFLPMLHSETTGLAVHEEHASIVPNGTNSTYSGAQGASEPGITRYSVGWR